MIIDSRRFGVRAAQVLLVALAFVIPAIIMRDKSVTSDETAHLPAGYSYLTTRVVKLNPMHPPLVKELAALPLLVLDPIMPVDPGTLVTQDLPLTYQWEFGKQFLDGEDGDRLLFWGRVPAVLLSAGLAVLVMLWAQRLWGPLAGLLALALYVFDPTITAHAQLVTTDVGMAFFGTLFLYLLRRYLDRPSWARLILAGLALGLALCAKFSGVVLVPIAAFLVLLAAWRDREQARTRNEGAQPGRGARRRAQRLAPAVTPTIANPLVGGPRSARLLCVAGATALLAVLASIVVWAIYFFPSDPLFYWKGIQTVNKDHNPSYPFYLMGTLKQGGWAYYLLVAWLLKTPLPSLLLLAGAVLAFWRGVRATWLDEAFLIVPAVAFFIGYSATADNLGVRYLIPVFPFFFIFTARLVPAVASARRWAAIAVGALLVWHVAEFVSIWPDHLSYFNQIAGGPRRGPEWLDDSNVDWGQGLIQLRRYLDAEGVRDYQICYFGNADLPRYGIHGQPLREVRPGVVVLSTHCWARLRASLERQYGRGPENWLAHSDAEGIRGPFLLRLRGSGT